MNVLDLYASIIIDTDGYERGLDDALESSNAFVGKIKQSFSAIVALTSTAFKGAAAGVTKLTKASIENYAEYEQLVGGVSTLWGQQYQSAEEYAKKTGSSLEFAQRVFEDYSNREAKIMENAANAYKTAGMSANEYMETVNGFAASLTSSLGQYEWQAANFAQMIVTDMADNANKMGTPLETIKNAYAAFAKQNYTLLDNLKLGYGGTQAEMQRLLEDAEKISGVKYDISSFADIAHAISTIQEEMGISGTTAAEAAKTIQGSIATMKAAWTNLVTGLGNDNASLEGLMGNLVDSVATVGENLMPRIMQVLEGIGQLIPRVAPIIIGTIPQIIDQVLPALIDGSVSIVSAIVTALPTIIQSLIDAAPTIVRTLADAIIDSAPLILTAIPQIIFALVDGFFMNLSEMNKIGEDLIRGIWEGISSMTRWIKDNINGLFKNIVDGVKELLGIHSPSTVFAEMGKNMALGIGEGWDKSFGDIKAGIEGGMNFDGDYSVNATSNGAGAAGGVTFSGLTININGANYSDEESLAEAISQRLQDMTVRKAAVYA